MTKRLISILLVVAMLLLTACSNTPAAEAPAANEAAGEEEPIKAVVISVMNGGSFWGPIEEGWLAKCEELGWQGEYWAPQTTNSATEMIELMETAMTQGYDVIAPIVTDLDIWGDVLTRAKEKGIVLMGCGSVFEGSDQFFSSAVGFDYFELGAAYGELMATAANKKGTTELNIVTMATAPNAVINGQIEAFYKALDEHFEGNVNKIADEFCESNAAKAQDMLNAHYLVHPEMNACASLENYGGLGATSFVQENGLTGQFYVNGVDDTEESLRLVKEGVLCGSAVLDLYGCGYQCAEIANKVLNGEEVDAFYPVGVNLIYAEDVDAYAASKGINLE